MNVDGNKFIECLCRRRKDLGKECSDSDLIRLLSKLTTYELRMIVDFGDVDSWIRDRQKPHDYETRASKI